MPATNRTTNRFEIDKYFRTPGVLICLYDKKDNKYVEVKMELLTVGTSQKNRKDSIVYQLIRQPSATENKS